MPDLFVGKLASGCYWGPDVSACSMEAPGRGPMVEEVRVMREEALASIEHEDVAADTVSYGRSIIEAEGKAVLEVANRVDHVFADVVDRIIRCRGRVVVTGMGKSGIVGQKISATLASTGTPSLYLHAAEAVHGDLGRITADDIVLALSNSGESAEIMKLVRPVKSFGAFLISLTGERESSLSRCADLALAIGNIAEACPMGLVPTASTTAMMVVGDALAMCLFRRRGLGTEEYARFHPGGALGKKLMRVADAMRVEDHNPIVRGHQTLREVIGVMTRTPGRPGAASVVDEDGVLVGFFTDGDLRRMIEDKKDILVSILLEL